MKRHIIILFVLSFLFNAKIVSQENKDVHYYISPSYKEDQRLDINFRYRTSSEGLLDLRYENNSWGDKGLFNCIKNLKVTPEPTELLILPDSSLIRIAGNPEQEFQISYSVVQDFVGKPLNEHRYRPIIQEDYFHILGMRLLILPTDLFPEEEDTALIKMTWKQLPDDDTFHSSFGTSYNIEEVLTQEEIYSTIFVGGDFRRYSFDLDSKRVYFLTRDEWLAIEEDSVFDILKNTIQNQFLFWEDSLKHDYSVTLLPTNEEWTETSKSLSLGGSGLRNSFISFASNNPGNEIGIVAWLYNHELLHNWFGQSIRNRNEEKEYWFSEGFTDYYAYKLMLKSNYYTPEEYIKTINREIIIPHYNSPVKTIANAEINYENYWSNRDYQKLSYRRGFLYAFLIDHQIKQKWKGQKSLDDLVRELHVASKNDKSLRFDAPLFSEYLVKYLDERSLLDFERYINNGELIDFQKIMPAMFSSNEEGIPVLTNLDSNNFILNR